jgi:hypothetical protein
MKRLFILIMVFVLALTACDALTASTEAPADPPTAEVVVVTVEVPVEVTAEASEAPPTAEPTATQPPTAVPTQAAPTEVPPTEVPPTEAAPAVSADMDGPIMVEASYWGDYFQDVTYTNPSFSLRCNPKENVFTATATDDHIVAVDFYYRIIDKLGTAPSAWKNVGKMVPAGNGTFTLTMSGEKVHPDLRKAQAWFDFQLVGLNTQGQAVGRTEKISQLVGYTIDCP